jgi:mannosyltransferase OCH1-like enzyme
MIPKIIHQIWIGKKQPPQELMDTWKIPGYEYVLWNEEKVDSLQMVNKDKYDYFYNKGLYYGSADIARVEILYQYGGLYIDADTKRLKDLPEEWFDYSFFAVQAAVSEQKTRYRIANSIMACEQESSLMKDYLDAITHAKKIEPCWSTIGGTTLTDIITKNYANDPNILILEPWTFFPMNSKKRKHEKYEDAYAIHFWGSKTKKIYK